MESMVTGMFGINGGDISVVREKIRKKIVKVI